MKIPVCVVQAGEDNVVWKQTNRWAARRLGRGRYAEVPAALHEVIMERDDLRRAFLDEFDALADYVAPVRAAEPAMEIPEAV